MLKEKWAQIHDDMDNRWAKLVEGNYVEGWHVWALTLRDEQGRQWCTRCQDYHHAPARDGMLEKSADD